MFLLSDKLVLQGQASSVLVYLFSVQDTVCVLAFYVYICQKAGGKTGGQAGAFSNDSDIYTSDLSRMPFLTLTHSNVQV